MTFLRSTCLCLLPIAPLFLSFAYSAMNPITTRESDIFDNECKFCAHVPKTFVEHVNTKICPSCYTWIAESVGLGNIGIRTTE